MANGCEMRMLLGCGDGKFDAPLSDAKQLLSQRSEELLIGAQLVPPLQVRQQTVEVIISSPPERMNATEINALVVKELIEQTPSEDHLPKMRATAHSGTYRRNACGASQRDFSARAHAVALVEQIVAYHGGHRRSCGCHFWRRVSC